ncbi:hypothetical protein B0X34_07915 [Helicobacter pylori]|nr:hypothetical protein [Helicobacter pylori]OOP84052.1 hypothetical protein B0X34_07915 [Helicobacter pylori]PDW54960.1 hypothetical protein BB438_06295 [Helicobacter pylori]
MAIKFDNNNNNSEEWQMLFNKINNGSPFGVIAFIGSILSHFKNVMRSGYLSSEPTKQDQIRSFLINKREFIGFVEIIIGPSESLFFVYENEPSTTFNLKNYLLVLATTHCNPTAICYCENKQDSQNTDTKEIKFLRTRTHFFGKEFGSTKVKIGISNPKTFWDSLLELRNEFYSFVLDENPIEDYKDFLIKNKKIINDRISITLYPHNDCFVDNKYSSSDFRINSTFEKHMEDIKSHYKRFRETFLLDYSETLPSETINKLKARVIEERDQQKEKNEIYKQSSAQNFKINEIAENLKSGKIVGERIISNALSYASKEYTGSSYCFIDPKDLETQLVQYKQDLLNDIIIEINQIKIEYNLLDDAFYFIFDIDNSHQLIVNVPRKELRDMRLPKMRTRESHSYLKIQSILKSCVRKGFYIIQNKTIVNILTPKSLEMQLLQKLSQNKADLSNHIIEVLNYQLSFQPHQPPIITYALIRKIRYNFNYNTFHFIFDIVNFLDEKLEFIIEVPREALDLENIDRLVEKNHSHGSLARHVREGYFILDTHLKE